MLQNKPLTAVEFETMIEQLEVIADRLFDAGRNSLGNNTQELVYNLLALQAEMDEAGELG
jgi:hypothetical protein